MNLAPTQTMIHTREGEELFSKLGIAVSDFRIFSGKHRRFVESSQVFLDRLRRFQADHPGAGNVLFVHRQGQVFFRKVPLAALTPPAVKLLQALKARKVEGLRFAPTCDLSGLTLAIDGLCAPAASGEECPWAAVNRRLEAEGLKGQLGFFKDSELAGLGELQEECADAPLGALQGPALLGLPQLAVPLDVYRGALGSLHDLMEPLSAGASPGFGGLGEVMAQICSGLQEDAESFLALARLPYGEQFTFNHSVNVCLLVMAVLKPLVKSPERLAQAGQAALLHDVGKCRVPQEILYRRAAPRAEERQEIERHVLHGAEVCQEALEVSPLCSLAAFDHHRRPGGGYPALRRERRVGALVSLIAAADLFEALTAERPYKTALPPAAAFQLLLELPEARGLEASVRLLYRALGPFPPGTLVELSTGETALVTRVPPGAPERPCVRRLAVEQGRLVIAREEIDLAAEGMGREAAAPRVARALPASWSPADAQAGNEAPGGAAEALEALRDARRRAAEGTLLATEG